MQNSSILMEIATCAGDGAPHRPSPAAAAAPAAGALQP